MTGEEVSQLVILGNGFDLKLGLKTKFEDYLGKMDISEDERGFNNLFEDLTDYMKLYTHSKLEKYGDNNLDNIKGVIFSIKENFSKFSEKYNSKKKSLLKFYVRFRLNLIKDITYCFAQRLKIGNQYKECLEEINKCELDLGLTLEKNKFTFWDLYFLYLRSLNKIEKDLNWSDVEGQILNFYTKKTNGENTYYEEIIFTMKKIGNDWNNVATHKLWPIAYILKENYRNIDKYLYQELIRFSQNFVDYLKNQYSQCYYRRDDYKLNIRWKFIDEKIADSEKYELLNFNYTNAEGYGCIKQIHIHGNKDKHNEIPIIGINAEDLTSNKEHAFKLTKQYQLISSENNKVEKLDLENIKRIVFYGHSLALADYQYFRNIFDRISLAESSVQLVFKYSKGYKNYDSIFKLLDRYSQDIDIDVTTTLTLENRLKVEEIPD